MESICGVFFQNEIVVKRMISYLQNQLLVVHFKATKPGYIYIFSDKTWCLFLFFPMMMGFKLSLLFSSDPMYGILGLKASFRFNG